jgi:hypothetical protein
LSARHERATHHKPRRRPYHKTVRRVLGEEAIPLRFVRRKGAAPRTTEGKVGVVGANEW